MDTYTSLTIRRKGRWFSMLEKITILIFFNRRILEHTGSTRPAQSLALSSILGATCTWHEIHVLHR